MDGSSRMMKADLFVRSDVGRGLPAADMCRRRATRMPRWRSIWSRARGVFFFEESDRAGGELVPEWVRRCWLSPLPIGRGCFRPSGVPGRGQPRRPGRGG
jgi:hypothetical protein